MAHAVPIAAGDAEWETLLLARRRSEVGLRVLIDAIRGREIVAGRVAPGAWFHDIHVRKDAVDALAAAAARPETEDALTGLVSAAVFGRSLGLRGTPNLTTLIEHGHTPAQRLLNPSTRRPQNFLSPEDIATFHWRFVTILSLADETGQPRGTISRLLSAAGIARFSPDGRNYGPIYLRDDAMRAVMEDLD